MRGIEFITWFITQLINKSYRQKRPTRQKEKKLQEKKRYYEATYLAGTA